MNRISNRLAVVGIGLLAPILLIIARLTWASTAPDPLPTHWNASGHVNGTTAATPYFWWTLAISAALVVAAAAVVFQRRSPDAGRVLVAILIGGSWQAAAMYALSVAVSRNAASAHAVHAPWFSVVFAVAVPLAIGALVWFLLPMQSVPVQQLPQAVLHLAPNEQATWISRAHSSGIRIATAVVAAAALVLALFSVSSAVIAFVVAMLLAGTSELAVRVDAQGLHTLWGPFGWPRQVIHLDEIAQVHAELINPMQRGGWGYRITSRGTAANIRSGPGIIVERTSGSTYVVTVDDAAEGADLLNALLVRARFTS